MKRNIIGLDELETAVEQNDEIELTKEESIKASSLIIVKRDGREEPYNSEKMRNVVQYATGNEHFTDELLRDTEIKLYDKIKITDLYDELIKTAVNKISMLYPQWEFIAAKLYLMKIYKDVWSIGDGHTLPHLSEVIKKGVQSHVYDKKIMDSFSEEDIEYLNEHINQENDYLFTYKALFTFFDKYCLSYSKTKKLELPQFTYMRVAMTLHWQDKDNRLERIVTTYKNNSSAAYTFGTPIMLNAATKNMQLSSCVLNEVDDDSGSILDTAKNLGIYSKFKGGTALDVTRLRSRGSYIVGNQGNSSGPVPFIKIVESVMKAFNQGGKRPGSNAVYFPWWHIDVESMIVLKSNGGTDENRARGLKYAAKVNQLFIDRIINDEEITLFDPKDVDDMIGTWGEDFEELYKAYEEKTTVRKKRMPARELWFKFMKERSETGNVYLFHEENVNNHNMTSRYINSSNLCTEILEPSRASKLEREELITREDGQKQIVKTYSAGEIALCNLASVNLVYYNSLDEQGKDDLIYDLNSTMDNTIDIARYPVKEGMNSNLQYRYLGLGVSNYANYLASKGIVIDTQEALEETHRLFDELSYRIIKTSMRLATERGKFEKFYETEWARGILPVHLANKNALKLTEYQPDMDKWNALAEQIKVNGVRNCLLMAIAPTATSGKAINATESIEPIQHMFYKEEGTTNVPTLVPNFRQNNAYYKRAFDCDQYKLIEGAAIRQIYLDQAQSVNLYISRPDSLMELTKLHAYGFHLGMKTFYYLKQQKEGEEEVCESCT